MGNSILHTLSVDIIIDSW